MKDEGGDSAAMTGLATNGELVETLPQIVWTAGPDGAITYFNRRWYEYTGLEEGARGLGDERSVLHPKDRDRTRRRWERACADGAPFEIEYRIFSRPLGAYRWFLARAVPVRDERGGIVMWSGTCTDIDDQKRLEEEVRRHAAELKVSRAELAQQARHDGLTGLANRNLFEERLRQSVAVSERNGRSLAVLFIDLDGFKQVNDTLGHAAGDTVLKQVADRLANRLRVGDTLARLGGDEFVAVAPELEGAADASALVRKLLHELAQPYEIGGQRVRVTASIGISLFPQDARDPDALLRRADVAMYRAKRAGKNDARFFAPDMQAAAQERLAISTQLEGALERGELTLHYQPQLDVQSGTVRSFEALVRWVNPALGAVEPSRFIPVAEESGLSFELSAWTVDRACARARSWTRTLGERVRVAVNVSLVQLEREDFVLTVSEAIARHGLEPDQLELELAADAGPREVDFALPAMESLRRLGVRLVLDDFGTEQAALTHLLRLPLDAIKIDQGVVHRSGAAAPREPERVLRALVGLAQALDLGVVAGGIETDEQYGSAVTAGCSRVQGFHLGRPMPAGDVEKALLRPPPLARPRAPEGDADPRIIKS